MYKCTYKYDPWLISYVKKWKNAVQPCSASFKINIYSCVFFISHWFILFMYVYGPFCLGHSMGMAVRECLVGFSSFLLPCGS